MPHFLKYSKMRGIIYCAQCLCVCGAYVIWNNVIYAEGYAGTLIGDSHRHLATAALGEIGQFSVTPPLKLPSEGD